MPHNATVARDLKERCLRASSVRRTGVRPKRAAKAQEMAAQEIDRLIDPSAPDEERQRRKRRLLEGPKSSEMCPAAIALNSSRARAGRVP
jgi:hypothetical protein